MGYETSGPLGQARRKEAAPFEDVLNFYGMNIDRLDIIRCSLATLARCTPSILPSYDFRRIVKAASHNPQYFGFVQRCIFQEVKLVFHIHTDLKLRRS